MSEVIARRLKDISPKAYEHPADRAATAMEGHLDGLQISMEDIRRMNPDFFYEDIHGKEDFLA